MFYRSRGPLAVVAAGALAVTLAACSNASDAPTGPDLSANRVGAMTTYNVGDQFKATEPLTFPMLYSNSPNYPLKADWLFWSELAKKTNVKIDNVAVPASDYEQKRSVLIGAGDAPFIIPKSYPHQENPFVSSGAILPVSDYIDLMPNYKAKVAKANLQPEIDTLRQADGKYYVLPGLHERPWQDYSLALRTDIMAQLNLKTPTTWDEFYEVLKAMRAAHPDVYPFSDRWSKPTPGGSLFNILGASYGVNGGWGYQHAAWDASSSTFVYAGASDKYKQWVTYLNKLVTEKLIDPESFTQTDEIARQKLANGKSFVISSNAQSLVNDYRPDLAKTIPGATMVKIPLPIGPEGEINPASRLENGIMISTKARDSKNFVAMMQFIDWLWYSDAGQDFAKWGIEGVTFTNDSSGHHTLAADVNVVGLHPSATKHLQKDFGFYNGVFAYGGKPELVQAFFSPEEQTVQKVMNARKPIAVAPPYPFTDEEREQATLWETPLKDYVFQQTLQFILGQRPLSDWNTYVNELKAKNSTQYIDLVNKAYQRYKTAHG
jgi:putative aldouronate transport system substrate-binding protein